MIEKQAQNFWNITIHNTIVNQLLNCSLYRTSQTRTPNKLLLWTVTAYQLQKIFHTLYTRIKKNNSQCILSPIKLIFYCQQYSTPQYFLHIIIVKWHWQLSDFMVFISIPYLFFFFLQQIKTFQFKQYAYNTSP